MASLDHRLNPFFSIKECMTCGALYTADFCCSEGDLEDKILVPKPPQNCATCGDPVDGLNCRPCAFVRKCLNEGWYTIHDQNEILNASVSSNHNTNVVSAPQEPIVFNQDPGKKSSQSPPQINHNCCYKCGDSLDGIFCQRCTCKSCGNGAHIGYNCPPKAPIISNPEPCNQTIDELPQTLPKFLYPRRAKPKKNTSLPLPYASKPNFVDNSPNVFDPPPQPSMYSCEFCGNDARYGHYCTPQVPFIYPEPCYNQDFKFPQDFHEFQQQYLCCENCEGPHETFQCQPMNEDYYEQDSCYDPNSFGFDQFQPPQYTVNHPIFNAQNEFLNSQNKLMEQMTSICDMEYTIAIKPVLPTDEDTLIMGDEHLNTIPETESDEIIKSSVENLVPIPSESEDFSDNESECDMPVCDDFTTFSNPLFDSDDDFCSNDDESFSDEDVPNENFKIYSNPLFDEEIISSKIKPHHFNAESDLIESLLNRDISTVSYPKIDSLLEEFSGELAHIDLIPPGIVDTDFDPKEEILLIEELLYDNSSPRPPEESNSEISNATIESLSPSPIPVEDSDSFMEEIDIFLASDDSTPPGVESDYDSEGDILLLEELLNDDLVPLAEYNHFTFDVEPDTAVKNDFDVLNEDECFDPRGRIPYDHEDPCLFLILQSSLGNSNILIYRYLLSFIILNNGFKDLRSEP
ncbi:hypothetical protein Tco_1142225 [Tanacetum coccineum]